MGAAYSIQGDDKGALMQMNCNVCHRYDRETKGADLINLGKKLVNEKGCRACHVVNGRGGTIGPDLTYVGDKAAEQYDMSRLGGQKTAFAWHVAHLKNPKELVPDTVMPTFGFGTKEAQALAALVLSWRRAPVPATYRPGVPRTDPQTPEEIAEEERMKHRAGRLVRQDRLLRLPLGLLARREERRPGRARPLDGRRGHAEPLRQDGRRLHQEPDRHDVRRPLAPDHPDRRREGGRDPEAARSLRRAPEAEVRPPAAH